MSNKETSKASAYRFCKIEASENIDALLEQIQIILNEGDSHNASVFQKEHWQWQYKNLPTHKALIYTAYNKQDKIVGYYHVPIYKGVIDKQEKIFAMVQDVAVSASERGQGLFRQLAIYANNDMLNHNINIAYTFPNKKSIHTFIKYNNYQFVAAYHTYLLPINTDKLIKTKIKNPLLRFFIGALLKSYAQCTKTKIIPIEKLTISTQVTEDISTYYNQFSSSAAIHLQRDFNYLDWRYNKKIIATHKIISIKKDNEIIASGIFKLDEIMGADAIVLMDFAFKTELDMIQLLHSVRAYAKDIFNKDTAMIFTAFLDTRFLRKKKNGFIKIPKRFNPRPLNLLVRQLNYQSNDCLNADNWLATLTDWDVF